MVKKWLESKKRKTEVEYDETKREFEMAIGKPFITIKVEQFHEEVKDLVKKRLILEKRRRKNKI